VDGALSIHHYGAVVDDFGAMMGTHLQDGFGRQIDYLRLSVTDRCDFRCVYCMAEDMTFLPRQQVLGLEELYRVASLFVGQGVKKIRLTGGEPLVRKGIVGLCEKIAALPGLRELVMTTNGSQLGKLARPLAEAGVKRLNISLDSLDPARFHAITRTGELQQVIDGIDAARAAGFARIKLNCVVMKGRNADEVADLVDFAIARQLDISFIEEMPLGVVGRDRGESFCSSDEVRMLIAERHALLDSAEQSGGPARYVRLREHPDTRIGFISPHSHNFCATCNRLRVTVEGRLLLCLGHENSIDLRGLLRRHPTSDAPVLDAIRAALMRKPQRHEFSAAGEVQVLRFMNASGG
jgi:cyclic pyranopterin phosphate synthase